MAAPRLRLDGVAPDCPDPMAVTWEEMVPMDIALSGRGVQQGRYRVTMTWENMADEDYAALCTIWKSKRYGTPGGFRLTSAVVPPFMGSDNASWPTVSGGVGGYILFRRPVALRQVLEARNVQVVLEDVGEPTES